MISKDQRFFICDTETNGIDKDSRAVELGIIVTDAEFSTIDFGEWLIHYEEGPFFGWAGKELLAYRVHGIDFEEMRKRAQPPQVVKSAILQMVKENTVHGRKPILISDNIVFEWRMISQIMDGDMSMFHYCGWDTSLFLESTGVGDPRNVPHRALKDCGRLQRAILEARDRTRDLR